MASVGRFIERRAAAQGEPGEERRRDRRSGTFSASVCGESRRTGTVEVLLSKRSKDRIGESDSRADAADLGAVAAGLHPADSTRT